MDEQPESGQPQDGPGEPTPSSEPTSASASSEGMSTGLKVGIGIGVVIAVLLLVLIFMQLSGGSGGSATDETPTPDAPVIEQPIAPTPTPGAEVGPGDGGIIIVVPTPVAGEPSVTANVPVNIRSGPSTAFPIIGLLNEGDTALVVGQNAASDWWAISLPGTGNGVGWVTADLVTASNTDGIPVVQPPIAPTPTTAPPIAITGWKGEYFDNPSLSGNPVLVRDDPEINFNWGSGSPAPEIPNDDFSVRWTINRNAQAGVYVFTVWVDDGVRVWVDEQLIINGWAEGQARNYTAEVEVGAGAHAIRVEYFEKVGGALISVNIGYRGEALPEAPSAVISGPTEAQVGQELTYSATGSTVASGGHINKTEWDFGDGGTSTGSPTTHVYSQAGTYTVLLTLTDDRGLTGSATQQVRVSSVDVPTEVPTEIPTEIPTEAPTEIPTEAPTEVPTEEPTAEPTAAVPVAGIVAPSSAAVSEVITFDGSSSTGITPIVSYQWDFGDGTVADGAVAEHTYVAPGPYQVTLTVVDGAGLSGVATMPITIVAEGEAVPLPGTTDP